jgi:xanthocillin biosynthesis cytochrome P450 monooxygenase
MKEFEDLLYDLVRNRPRKNLKTEKDPSEDDLVVHMMERALEEGRITDEQFRANLKIVFLTAHENVQQLLSSTFWELGKNRVRGCSARPSSARELVEMDSLLTNTPFSR